MNSLEEIIKLIEITGDKCVFLSQEHGAYVVVKIEEYKKLIIKDQKIVQNKENTSVSMPDTDVKQYEIPHVNQNNNDIYYPEPLEEKAVK